MHVTPDRIRSAYICKVGVMDLYSGTGNDFNQLATLRRPIQSVYSPAACASSSLRTPQLITTTK